MARIPAWVAMEEFNEASAVDLINPVETVEEANDISDSVAEGEDLADALTQVTEITDVVGQADEISPTEQQLVSVGTESFAKRWFVKPVSVGVESHGSYSNKKNVLFALEGMASDLWKRFVAWLRDMCTRIKEFFKRMFGMGKDAEKEASEAKAIISKGDAKKVDALRLEHVVVKPQPKVNKDNLAKMVDPEEPAAPKMSSSTDFTLSGDTKVTSAKRPRRTTNLKTQTISGALPDLSSAENKLAIKELDGLIKGVAGSGDFVNIVAKMADTYATCIEELIEYARDGKDKYSTYRGYIELGGLNRINYDFNLPREYYNKLHALDDKYSNVYGTPVGALCATMVGNDKNRMYNKITFVPMDFIKSPVVVDTMTSEMIKNAAAALSNIGRSLNNCQRTFERTNAGIEKSITYIEQLENLDLDKEMLGEVKKLITDCATSVTSLQQAAMMLLEQGRRLCNGVLSV